MTMLANREEGRVLTLADYEARIHLYKEQIGTGYIGIGRTLLEAKEAKAVPHGQWEAWVTETTGLTARQAQRCMQAATEIRDGSAMARLEMSKALMLLGSGLDEEAREEIAEKAADEGATVKALREEIRQAKVKLVQETGAATEMRMELKQVKAERDGLAYQMKAQIGAYQKRMDEEAEKAYREGMKEGRDNAAGVAARELADKDAEIRRLKNDLEQNRQQQGMQDREILMAAAEEAEKRAADAEAELEALKAGQDPAKVPLAIVLARALGAFFGECDSMPWFVTELQEMPGPILNSVGQLEDWCGRMRAAMNSTVEVEGAVE